MTERPNQPAARNWLSWFDLRGRDLGTIGFVLNRLTGLGLTVYLFLHLIVLGQLARGPEGYNSFLELTHNFWFILGELLVIVAVFYHGLNGLRIALNSFGVGVRQQKAWLVIVILITVAAAIAFGVIMF